MGYHFPLHRDGLAGKNGEASWPIFKFQSRTENLLLGLGFKNDVPSQVLRVNISSAAGVADMGAAMPLLASVYLSQASTTEIQDDWQSSERGREPLPGESTGGK